MADLATQLQPLARAAGNEGSAKSPPSMDPASAPAVRTLPATPDTLHYAAHQTLGRDASRPPQGRCSGRR